MAAGTRSSWAHGIGRGRFGRVMTDDETESVLSDSHEGSELELPVIQLCGLVEELRYRRPRLGAAPLPPGPSSPGGLGLGDQHGEDPSPH